MSIDKAFNNATGLSVSPSEGLMTGMDALRENTVTITTAPIMDTLVDRFSGPKVSNSVTPKQKNTPNGPNVKTNPVSNAVKTIKAQQPNVKLNDRQATTGQGASSQSIGAKGADQAKKAKASKQELKDMQQAQGGQAPGQSGLSNAGALGSLAVGVVNPQVGVALASIQAVKKMYEKSEFSERLAKGRVQEPDYGYSSPKREGQNIMQARPTDTPGGQPMSDFSKRMSEGPGFGKFDEASMETTSASLQGMTGAKGIGMGNIEGLIKHLDRMEEDGKLAAGMQQKRENNGLQANAENLDRAAPTTMYASREMSINAFNN